VLGHRGFAAPLLFNHHQGETLCQRKECFETEEQNLWRVMPRVVAESGGRVVAESGGREWWPSGGRVVSEWWPSGGRVGGGSLSFLGGERHLRRDRVMTDITNVTMTHQS
jgi:hypothetical protein